MAGQLHPLFEEASLILVLTSVGVDRGLPPDLAGAVGAASGEEGCVLVELALEYVLVRMRFYLLL
jgi:hypothetical protein